MPTGTELQADVADLVQVYDTNVAAENTRCLRMGSVAQREIAAEVVAIDEDWLLRSQTFPTVADRYPNRYSLPSDFWNFRYLERVVDATTGSVDRIPPIQHIPDKEFSSDRFRTDASAVAATGPPEGYLLGDDFIEIKPISDAVYTCRIWYEKTLADLEAANDIELPYPMYQALVYKTAIHMLVYTNQPFGDMERLYQQALVRAVGSLHQRADDGPRVVQYVSERGEYV